ncbi:MAG: peptide chain release factor N(5)-glutamine methyltransferase [Acetatifactor sp.]|nr:peptide chain release factor N(5)-glutamine methyltransferase [Acetatifactor sp.]
MTYRDLYQEGCTLLQDAGIEEYLLDARLLLEYVCGTGRNDLLVHGDTEVLVENEERYRKLLARRRQRIPLQHLTGTQDFMGLEFLVNENVLIPRQDTEILVEEILCELHDGMRILDMCTGSGCILISLLNYSNNCYGVGADISAKALEVAGENARKLLPDREISTDSFEEDSFESQKCISLVQGDLFENISGKYDIIVSNPPYIASNVIPTLMPEVKEHEPMLALDGEADGLSFYRRIVTESARYLRSGGRLYFEIGYDQKEAVCGLMEAAGFTEVCAKQDYAGLDRVVYGIWIEKGE